MNIPLRSGCLAEAGRDGTVETRVATFDGVIGAPGSAEIITEWRTAGGRRRGWIGRSLHRLIARARKRRQRTRRVASFAGFNEHLLADIGVTRDWIPARARRSSRPRSTDFR